ncbi:hypothetical protein ACYU03_11710 [Pseudomonas sp. X10]
MIKEIDPMAQTETPAGQGRTSRQGSVTVVEHQSVQCYFRPDTEELVFLADSEAGEFEVHWQEMLTRMSAFHSANAGYSSALERYAKAYSSPGALALVVEPEMKALRAAEEVLEQRRTALQEHLGQFSAEGMRYDDVIELLPIADTRKRSNQSGKGRSGHRYVYVKKRYYDVKQQRMHKVSLKAKDKQGASESIYSRDKNGKMRIDTGKLRKQLTTLQSPTLKLGLKDVARLFGFEDPTADLNTEGTVDWKPFGFELFSWAERWNESLQGEDQWGDSVDVSASAQFMRYASNVGVNAEYDPVTGQVLFKGEGQTNLALASGTAQLSAYVPDRLGWSLKYTNQRGQVFDMGMLRAHINPQLKGFIGASVLLEGQLQVVVKDDQQILAGQPGGRLPRFSERKARGAAFHQQMEAEDEGLSLSSQTFAGIQVEGRLKGALQWLKPAPPPDMNGPAAAILKSTGEFTDFCSITSEVGGLAGVGAGGKFYCTFINGKFCFHVAASLCWGRGAKGGLIGEVSVANIVEFGSWLVYQLYGLNYSFLDLIDSGAFKAYTAICVMQMAFPRRGIYGSYNDVNRSVGQVVADLSKFVESLWKSGDDGLNGSRRRNDLAARVVRSHNDLLRFTPEGKGVLLYLLTRHGIWDHMDLENYGEGLIPDIYQQRKEAVILVLTSIQTKAEWRKVLCRMTPDGSTLASSSNEFSTADAQEQHLVNFLKEGFDRDHDLLKAKEELLAIRGRLKVEVAWGYALAMNDSFYYRVNSIADVHYCRRGSFGPCVEMGV